jgi:hypothetical protein
MDSSLYMVQYLLEPNIESREVLEEKIFWKNVHKKNQENSNFILLKKKVTNWRESTKKQPHWWFQTH